MIISCSSSYDKLAVKCSPRLARVTGVTRGVKNIGRGERGVKKWGAAANNHSYSRKNKVFSVRPGPFVRERVSESVCVVFSKTYIHLALIFLPSSKIFKTLDERSFNVQRHRPNSNFHQLDLKSIQNAYVLGAFSGWVVEILAKSLFLEMPLHVEGPFDKSFEYFWTW